MKKIFISLIIVMASLGYFGFEQYQQSKLVDSLVPHIKNASLRLTNTIHYETDKNTKITYKELFEKIESDISELDKRMLEVQTLATPKTSETTDPAVAYLKSSQELLRALLQKYQKSFALNNAMSWTQKQLDEYRTSSGYSVEYAKHSLDKAIKDFHEAEQEMNAAIPGIITSAKRLKEVRNQLARTFSVDVLVPETELDKLVQTNTPLPKKK